MAQPFVHLRAHSFHSMTEGLLSPQDLVDLAVADGQAAIAVTDRDSIAGLVQFQTAAVAAGITPILGVDITLDLDSSLPPAPDGTPVAGRVALVCNDDTGYRNLLSLADRALRENMRAGTPAVRESWLSPATAAGLTLLTGEAGAGLLPSLVAPPSDQPADAPPRCDAETAARVLRGLSHAFGGRVAIEIQRIDQPREREEGERLCALSAATGIPAIATHPILFATRADFASHELRTASARNESVYATGRPYTREQAFQTTAAMEELFADAPVLLDNARALAARCTARIPVGKAFLPCYPDLRPGETESAALERLAFAGLDRRLGRAFPDPDERARQRPAYEQRLRHEIGVINGMGFPGYFLTVADVIQWAKTSGIAIGVGRGSGAGSLVAYSLGITGIDPLPYNLLFERFLNPERVSMPDIDTDIETARRLEVIDYIRRRYGTDKTALISTLGTMGAAKAVNQTAKVLGLNFNLSLSITREFDKKTDEAVAKAAHILEIDAAVQRSATLRERIEREPSVRRLLSLARGLEGIPDTVGVHAGGIVIAPGPISEFSTVVPTEKGFATQLDKDDIEKVGLIKFDFLGLETLTVLRLATEMVARTHPEQPPIDLEAVPLDDPATLALLAAGDTTGVFQFESQGMRDWLRQIHPDRFEDLIAAVALYRPGPMDLLPMYVARKHGREPVTYPDPRVETVLRETFGIMVYQEQVMQMAQIVGGYTLGNADLLRRAMGKKKAEEMASQRAAFERGAAAQGIGVETAKTLFDTIEKFAGYGFNKSHATAYAHVAVQTAWMKAHHPHEFFAAAIATKAMDNKMDAAAVLVADARAHGLVIRPPDINTSDEYVTVEADGALRYGLACIKGVKEGTAHQIRAERNANGPFTDLADFYTRIQGITAAALAPLAQAGAFDSVEPNRAKALAAVKTGRAHQTAMARHLAKSKSVTGEMAAALAAPALTKTGKPRKTRPLAPPPPPPAFEDVLPWDDDTRLMEEARALGFYLSGSPLDNRRRDLGGLDGFATPSDLTGREPGTGIWAVGIVTRIKTRVDRNGNTMAFLTIGDGQAERDVTVFSAVHARAAPVLVENQFVAIAGKVEKPRDMIRAAAGDMGDAPASGPIGQNKILADDILDADGLAARLADRLDINTSLGGLDALKEVLDRHAPSAAASGVPVRIHLETTNPAACLRADLPRRVAPSLRLLADVTRALGADNVRMAWKASLPLPSTGPSRRGTRERPPER